MPTARKPRPEKITPPATMVYLCIDRYGVEHAHPMPGSLSAKEAMGRLGVLDRPFKVQRHPDGRPDLTHTVQDMPR
jgi:hypothetical protein